MQQSGELKEFYKSFLSSEAKSAARVQAKEEQTAEKAKKFKEFVQRQQDVLAAAENMLLALGATEESEQDPESTTYDSVVTGGNTGGGTISIRPSSVELNVRQFVCASPIVELGNHEFDEKTFSSGVQVFMNCRETRKVVETKDEKDAQVMRCDDVTGFGLRYLKLTDGSDPVVVKTFRSGDVHLNPGLLEHGSDQTLSRLAYDSNQLANINSGLNEISAVVGFVPE